MKPGTDNQRLRRANRILQELVHTHYQDTDKRLEKERHKDVTCTKGCSACCRQMTIATAAEAQYVVHTRPEVVRRALPVLMRQNELLSRMQGQTPTDSLLDEATTQKLCDLWWEAGEQCAFLEEDVCTIYAQRPRACRTYFVTSDPALCGSEKVGTEVTVARPGSKTRGDLEMFAITQELFGTLILGPWPVLVLKAWEVAHG